MGDEWIGATAKESTMCQIGRCTCCKTVNRICRHLHAWWTRSALPSPHQHPKTFWHYPSHVNAQKMCLITRRSSLFSMTKMEGIGIQQLDVPWRPKSQSHLLKTGPSALGFVDLFLGHHVITSSHVIPNAPEGESTDAFIQLIHSTMRSPPNKEEDEEYQMDISYQDLLVEEKQTFKALFKSFLVSRPVSRWFIGSLSTILILL